MSFNEWRNKLAGDNIVRQRDYEPTIALHTHDRIIYEHTPIKLQAMEGLQL